MSDLNVNPNVHVLIKKKHVPQEPSQFNSTEPSNENLQNEDDPKKSSVLWPFSILSDNDEKEQKKEENENQKREIHHLGPKKPQLINGKNKEQFYSDLREKVNTLKKLGFFDPKKHGNHLQGQEWVNDIKKKNKNQNLINKGKLEVIKKQKTLHDKITYIEPSQAEQILQQEKKTRRSFQDWKFPPNLSSLVGFDQIPKNWRMLQWKRLSDMIPNPKIFVKKIQPKDIKQGMLGDCYFLAALAAIAERPDRIVEIFLLDQINQQRYFSVKILYRGKWRKIDLDQYVPFYGNQPAFSKTVGGELWVIILQKAWAKLYHSYKKCAGGLPEEGLHDLTGAPIKTMDLKSRYFNEQEQWKYLLTVSKKQYAMVASSQSGSDTQQSQLGIVLGHAYTFLNALEIIVQDRKQRIVQLRNPWGDVEFRGKFSDRDPIWEKVVPKYKEITGFNPNIKDGIFFMTFYDFQREFKSLDIAEIIDNASYVYASSKDTQMNGAHFSIDILHQGQYSFHVDNTPHRSFSRRQIYPETVLTIKKVDESRLNIFPGKITRRRTLFHLEKLKPGKYVAFVEIKFNRYVEKDFEINLAVYSQYACGIRVSNEEQVKQYTTNNYGWKQEKSHSPEQNNKYKQEMYQYFRKIGATKKVQEVEEKEQVLETEEPKNVSQVSQKSGLYVIDEKSECEKESEIQYIKINDHSQTKEEINESKQKTKKQEPKQEVKNESEQKFQQEPKKKKRLRKIEHQVVTTETTHSLKTGEQKIRTKVIENEKQTLSMKVGEGMKKKSKNIQNVKTTIEDLYKGESLKKVETFTQKIQIFQQNQKGEKMSKTQKREGKVETIEEQGEYSSLREISDIQLHSNHKYNSNELKLESESSECDTEEKQRRYNEYKRMMESNPQYRNLKVVNIDDSDSDFERNYSDQ